MPAAETRLPSRTALLSSPIVRLPLADLPVITRIFPSHYFIDRSRQITRTRFRILPRIDRYSAQIVLLYLLISVSGLREIVYNTYAIPMCSKIQNLTQTRVR